MARFSKNAVQFSTLKVHQAFTQMETIDLQKAPIPPIGRAGGASAPLTALDRMVGLLGPDVFFVPCEWGTKKPILTYVERPFESTKSDAYRAVLEQPDTNIAIYLGQSSGGLCAIDFDSDEDLAAFLELNPKLATTTRSRGSRGGMIWVRIQGEYPESCNPEHKHFEWRADKRLSTIYGRHPKGMDYVLLVDAPPVTLPFADIVWPTDWELPWVGATERDSAAALIKEYGQPYYFSEFGSVTSINERYWAALYARENRVLFDPDERTFYRYAPDTGLWEVITAEIIREVISARILEVSREARVFSLESKITQSRLNAVVSALKGIVERRGVFTHKQRYIHVANGVIRFTADDDIQFGGFSPEDYSRNRSPFDFVPDAECPRFLNELIHPALDPDDADLLQRWFGLALFGYNLPQRFIILDGMPNGGKSTVVKIIQALVGSVNTYQLRTESLQERFETYRYRGKTLLIGPDVRGDFLMERGASMLKVLVGGDPISAEGKGLNGDFPMFGTFNIVVTCNSRLRLRLEGDAGAWRRRLLVLRYEKPPPAKRVLDFDRVLLREEGSGILRWALNGFVKLQTEFAELGDFKLTDAQRARVESLLAESDSLRLFVTERLVQHEYGDVTTSEISQAYSEYCADKGWNALPSAVVERTLPDLMLQMFHVTKSHSIERDGKSNRGWHKVKLLEATELSLGGMA
jgi:P4 family phage/plasmid primase-like protien